MRLEVPLYRQTTDFSCGACATLMVWKYFDGKAQLSKRNEFLIRTEIVALPFKFSSPYRIAEFFINRGFETKLMMKQEEISEDITLLECYQADPAERKRFLNIFKEHNTQAVIMSLKRSIASAILDRKPKLLDIRRALSNNSPVIALVDSYYTTKIRGAENPLHLPHWIVVSGYEDEKFHVNDSINEKGLKNGKTMIESHVLERAMDTYPRFGWPSALIVIGLKTNESNVQGGR